MIDIYSTPAAHQQTALHAIARGIDDDTRILPVTHIGHISAATTCICWGTRFLTSLETHYDQVVVVERGYFNDRTKNYSVGFNGLNGRANFNNRNSPPDRWLAGGVKMQPWSSRGDYYLIIGQTPGDMSITGVDMDNWYRTIIDELDQLTDLPIYFRPHPLARQKINLDIDVQVGDLAVALQNAAGVVTYNSNVGVDATLAGVPVLAQDEGSMAWDMAAHTVHELHVWNPFDYTERMQWAYNLAYTQWTLNELESGDAWRHLHNEK